MPGMKDPNFARTLTFVCEHGEHGALGLIVNRPTELTLEGLLERVDIEPKAGNLPRLPVYFGGPVQTDRGFVLHRPLGDWQATLDVGNGLGMTSSKDILVAVGETGEPREMLVTLGYSGWSAGQLEWEISQNAWLTVAADPEVVFSMPAEARLAAALQLLGVDLAMLSEEAGHA